MSGWKPEKVRPRTKILAAAGIVAVLAVLTIIAIVVPPRTVARIAVVTTPYAQLVGFLGGIAVIITYVRKLVLSAVNATQDAAVESARASGRAEEASRETSALVNTLQGQLQSTQSARDREAFRNDKVFTALLESQVASRELAKWVAGQNLPYRVRELEEFAAARETEEHITGRLRLHETMPPLGEQDFL